MAGPRKIPMHRARGAAARAARPASHPGVGAGAGGDKGPTFISPFQPPPANDDFAADIDPHGWKTVTVGEFTFRVRSPQPEAISVLSMAWSHHQRSAAIKHSTLVDFVARYTHPDDLAVVLPIMADPDDERFQQAQFNELVKRITTVGTARPFWPSLAW